MSSPHQWARDEVGDADLGHAARTTRAVSMLAQLFERPEGTVSHAFPSSAQRKGAYSFLERDNVEHAPIAHAMHAAAARRCMRHKIVIVPVDGSSLAHTDTHGTHGVGPIGSRAIGARGLKSMILVPLSLDGVPLGVGAHVLWARSATPDPVPHAKRELKDKESQHWTALQRDFEAVLAEQGADTKPWYQTDSEGDANHQLLRGLEPDALFTTRSHIDRLLTAKSSRRHHLKLHEAITSTPAMGAMYVELPATRERVARVARLEVRAAAVGLKLRAQWSHRKLADVAITAVHVTEVGSCSEGAEPLDWLLLTSYPVKSFADAVHVVRMYGLRWVIERIHYTWKSGTCNVEHAQLESFGALTKWATLHLSVAIERQALLQLSRTRPDLPSDEHFDRDAIDAALTLFTQHRKDGPQPGSTPSLGTLMDIIARLGGYIGKSSGGPPGIKVFQRGMERVESAALILKIQRLSAKPPTSTDGFG